MNLDDIKILYEYNYWANKQILSIAKQVTTEQLMMPTSFSWGNLFGTLVHLLDSEYGWRVLCKDGIVTFAMQPDDFPDLASVDAHWNTEMVDMWAYLNSLTDDDLQGTISYKVEEGTRKRVLWHCLWHVVNHGMQHRSECAVMLTNFDKSPGDLDFTVFLNQR